MLYHTAEGAMGLIFNNLVNHIEVKSFFKISDDQVDSNIMMPIYLGRPVEHERGFFLHSDDYDENLLLKFQNHLAVSSNPKIPNDIASGHGPKNSFLLLDTLLGRQGSLKQRLRKICG